MPGMHIVADHMPLKKCPFCGGKAHVVEESSKIFNKVTVVCDGCHARISIKDINKVSVERVCEKWNAREEIKK